MQEVQTQINRKLKEIKSDVLLVEGICELSSEHINVKHKILEKDKFEFETLIDRMMLSEQEEKMMHLRIEQETSSIRQLYGEIALKNFVKSLIACQEMAGKLFIWSTMTTS